MRKLFSKLSWRWATFLSLRSQRAARSQPWPIQVPRKILRDTNPKASFHRDNPCLDSSTTLQRPDSSTHVIQLSDFTYERLNWASNEIRLVQILPQDLKTRDDEGPLACTITNVSLGDKPSYVALSYAWEDTTRVKPLILNGRLTHVTSSLDVALRQIRRMQVKGDTFQASRLFWVDAICINQDDEIEKSWQVQQMNRIFQEAEYALVWLGPSADNSNVAMEVLQHVGVAIASKLDHADNPTLSSFELLSNLRDEFSFSLKALLQRTWWRRIWIVQEFASAKDVVFLCGDVCLSWHSCFRALGVLEKFKRAIADRGWRGSIGSHEYQQFMAEITSLSAVLRLFGIRRTLNHDQKKLSLWELLTLKRFGMQATDTRDFVYALTGIADDASAKHLFPDYTKHVRDVYTQVAKSFLAEGRLRTLWLCSHPRRIPNLPSWVPDWSSIWQADRRYLSGDAGYGSGSSIFEASRKFRPIVSFSSQNSQTILHLQGFHFDTVETTKPAFDIHRVLGQGDLTHTNIALEARCQAFRELHSDWDTVFRCVTADIELLWSSDVRFTYRRSSRKLRRQLYELLILSPEDRRLKDSLGLAASLLDILYRHNGRRPFITKRGHLGVGPAGMQSGDTVAVILGSEVPFIFREIEGGYFQVVGEAYVDKIMDGEVMDMQLRKTSFHIV